MFHLDPRSNPPAAAMESCAEALHASNKKILNITQQKCSRRLSITA